jgi:hypothetical protein
VTAILKDQQAIDSSISYKTIGRAVAHDMELRPVEQRPILSANSRKKRVKWCKQQHNPNRVMAIDSTYFTLGTVQKRRKYWVMKGQPVIAGRPNRNAQVHVYGGITAYGKTSLRRVTGTTGHPEKYYNSKGQMSGVGAEEFQEVLGQTLVPEAQQIFAERARFYTPEYMLEKLDSLFKMHGLVRSSLVRSAADMPSPSTYLKHFGSMDAAFQQLFHEARTAAGNQVSEHIEALVNQVIVYEDFLVIDEKLTVLVQPSVPMPYGFAHYWFFRPDRRDIIDITLGVPLSEGAQPRILGYLALPRLLVPDHWIRLFSTSNSRLEMYGHNGLDILGQLLS